MPRYSKHKPMPRFPRNINTRQDRSEFVTGGGMIQLLNSMPPPVAHWLIDTIPEGATLSDAIRAIIIDAYHDEISDKPA